MRSIIYRPNICYDCGSAILIGRSNDSESNQSHATKIHTCPITILAISIDLLFSTIPFNELEAFEVIIAVISIVDADFNLCNFLIKSFCCRAGCCFISKKLSLRLPSCQTGVWFKRNLKSCGFCRVLIDCHRLKHIEIFWCIPFERGYRAVSSPTDPVLRPVCVHIIESRRIQMIKMPRSFTCMSQFLLLLIFVSPLT